MLNRDNPIPAAYGRASERGALPSVVRAGAAGFEELLGGLRYWRVWHLLGILELRHRYARSKLGQAWLMLSTAVMIGALGSIWSILWQQPVRELLPFIGVGLIMWTYLSHALNDCTSAFVTHSHLYRNQKMNFSVSIYSVIYKNTLILAHNVVIIAILVVALGVPINWYVLQIIPAFLLTWITMLWVGYVTGMLCARYRDIIQVVTTWLMVLFFITPVMWRPDFLPPRYRFLVDLNPLAQFLEVLRNPLLGQSVSVYTWFITTAIAVGGGLLALAVIGRYQRRIIFWM
jgi:ABC-type polysaccharide/polyol phosphate export permease